MRILRPVVDIANPLLQAPPSMCAPNETMVADTAVEPEKRTLVLTAFPAEADAILARTTLDENPVIVVDGRHFYLGTLGGKKVIVAMTGIGMANAADTTETALTHFTPGSGVSIDAVVYAGVAGGSGRTQIGDVAVPAQWTSDDGATWHPVDPEMLAAADEIMVDLQSTDTIADPSRRICGPLSRLRLVNLDREPQLYVGGDGSSDDNNNGAAFPSIPLGGAIFGPQPLAAPDFSPLFTGNFFRAAGPFLIRGVVSNITGFLTATAPRVDAVDQETAAAQQVADAHGVPFLGIRGMSDGPGDPLNLPGYPFTFFVYKQLAADNAAIVTEAFLQTCNRHLTERRELSARSAVVRVVLDVHPGSVGQSKATDDGDDRGDDDVDRDRIRRPRLVQQPCRQQRSRSACEHRCQLIAETGTAVAQVCGEAFADQCGLRTVHHRVDDHREHDHDEDRHGTAVGQHVEVREREHPGGHRTGRVHLSPAQRVRQVREVRDRREFDGGTDQDRRENERLAVVVALARHTSARTW